MNKDIPNIKKFAWDAMENCTLIDSEKITSSVFEIPIGGKTTEWHLELSHKNCLLKLTLNHKLMSRCDFSIKYSLSFIGEAGEYVQKLSYHLYRRKWEYEVDKKSSTHCRLAHSLDLYLLESNVPDRKLRVGCDIIILTSKPIDKQRLTPALSADIQRMYEKELFTDFEFRCNDGVSVKCHRSVLAARSPVFEAMLSNDMEEAREGFADVPDCDSNLMKEFLRFIYCGNVLYIRDFAKDLIFLADKYDIESLKDLCVNNCIKTLKRANIVENLQIVDKISGCIRLFEECFLMIGGDFTEISKTEDWKELSKEMLKKIAMLKDTTIENLE